MFDWSNLSRLWQDWYHIYVGNRARVGLGHIFLNLKFLPVLINRVWSTKRSRCAMCLAEMRLTITKEACHPCFNQKPQEAHRWFMNKKCVCFTFSRQSYLRIRPKGFFRFHNYVDSMQQLLHYPKGGGDAWGRWLRSLVFGNGLL